MYVVVGGAGGGGAGGCGFGPRSKFFKASVPQAAPEAVIQEAVGPETLGVTVREIVVHAGADPAPAAGVSADSGTGGGNGGFGRGGGAGGFGPVAGAPASVPLPASSVPLPAASVSLPAAFVPWPTAFAWQGLGGQAIATAVYDGRDERKPTDGQREFGYIVVQAGDLVQIG